MYCDETIKEHFPNVPFTDYDVIGFVNTPNGEEWFLATMVKKEENLEDCLFKITSQINGPVNKGFVAFIDPLYHEQGRRGFSFVKEGEYYKACKEIYFFAEAFANGYADWKSLHVFEDGKMTILKGVSVYATEKGACIQKNNWPFSRLIFYKADELGRISSKPTETKWRFNPCQYFLGSEVMPLLD